jgi:hypothetical protein
MQFFGLIRELVEMSKLHRISQVDRRRAREIFCELVGWDFTPKEIETLTAKRWSKDTIRKYTVGVEVRNMADKEKVLKVLGEFIDKDLGWEDVEKTAKINRLLKGYEEEVTLEDLVSVIIDCVAHKYTISDVQFLAGWINQWGINRDNYFKKIELVNRLTGLGYNEYILEELLKVAEKYGEPRYVVEALDRYGEVNKIKDEIKEKENKVLGLGNALIQMEAKLNLLNSQAATTKSYNTIVFTLVNAYGFDLNAFQQILNLAKKFGSAFQIIDALNMYRQKEDLSAEVAIIKSAIEGMRIEETSKKGELKVLDEKLAEYQREVGRVEERHRKSRTLQNLANLLDDPHTQMDYKGYLVFALTVLTALKNYGYVQSETLGKWSLYIQNDLNHLVRNLNNIIVGKI